MGTNSHTQLANFGEILLVFVLVHGDLSDIICIESYFLIFLCTCGNLLKFMITKKKSGELLACR